MLPTLAGILVLAVVGTVLVRTQERRLWDEEAEKLEAIAALKATQIAAWRAERLADGGMITYSHNFGKFTGEWLEHGDTPTGEAIRHYFSNLAKLQGYREVLLVDRQGSVRLRLAGSAGELAPEARPALERALATGVPTLTDLYLGEDGTPQLGAVAPLPAEDGPSRGAVVLQSDANQSLFPLIQTWPLPSRTAESLLVQQQAGDVLYLNELRHEHHTALRLRRPLDDEELPAGRAVRGESGPFAGRDYRGVEVLATWRAVPNSPWFLIAKVDREEALAAGRGQLRLLVGLLFALGAAGILVVLAAWQRAARAHVSERLALAQHLQASEARHAVTLRSIGDAIISTDREGRIELLNPVAERLTGWHQAEAAGRPLAEVFRIVNEETRAVVEDPVARVLREGEVVGLANHTLLLARDGSEIPIADAGAPIRTDDGEIIGVVLNFRDQSKELAAKRALQESEARYRALFAAHPEAMWVYDLDTLAILAVNDAAVATYGYSRDEFLGMTIRDLRPAEDLPRLELSVADARRAPGHKRSGGWRHVTKDGRQLDVEISSHELLFAGRRVRVVVARDVSERRRLEQQLAQAQKLEAIGTLAGGIAHDFNNLLQALLATVQTTQRQGGDGKVGAALATIEALARRGADLTRQLLFFARRQPGQRQPVELAKLLHEQAAWLGRLLPENVHLELDSPPQGLMVDADASQLAQVVTNLAVNARDAMPGGGTLTLRAAAQGGEVHLEVRDTGVGMSEEVRQRIFDPFFTTKPLGKGTGLGLPMVWGIVHEHGGGIAVDSAPGAGTAVRITLPASSAPLGDMEEVSSGDHLVLGAGERVLVVEDEPEARSALTELLIELGYAVAAAGSAEEALRLPAEPGFDVLLTDYLLPDVTGLELAGEMEKRWPDLQVVVMSGYTPDDVAGHLLASGHRHFLQKPFDMKALARAMRAALRPRLATSDRPS